MAPFEIEVDAGAVTAALTRLAERCEDLTPAMRAIAMALQSQTEENFETESGPLGKWPAVKDPKRKGGKILQDTGRLAASVTPFWSADEAGIGSNAVYAAIHQLGGKAGRGLKATIPPRPYLPATAAGLQPEAVERALDVIHEHLLGYAD